MGKVIQKQKDFTTPEGAILTPAGRQTWEDAQRAIGAPVALNDFSLAQSWAWPEVDKAPLAWADALKKLASANAQGKAGTVAMLHADGRLASVAEWASIMDTTPSALYVPLAKSGALDPREQARLECFVCDWSVERNRRASRAYANGAAYVHRSPEEIASNDAVAWGRLFTGNLTGFSPSKGRDLAKRWLPALAAQYPKETPAIVKGAMAWALARSATNVSLPKASSPTALTPAQASFEKTLSQCEAFVEAAEKALKAAKAPVAASSMKPDFLIRARAAFDAKAAKLAESQAPGEKNKSAAVGNAETNASAGSPWGDRFAAGRRELAVAAATHLDPQALEWIIAQSPDGGKWAADPIMGSRLLAAVSEAMGSAQRSPASGAEGPIASERAGQIVDVLCSMGLSLLDEARESSLKTDNPFSRPIYLCVYDKHGAMASRLAERAVSQMRDAGLTLADAGDFLAEALGPASATSWVPHEQKEPIANLARASMERWQISAEIDRLSLSGQSGGPTARSEADAGQEQKEKSAPAAPRRSARL